MKEAAIELWECIQAHVVLKQIGKIIAKHDIEDYVIFIRTERNTFLRGCTGMGDVVGQLAQLIENAASDIGKTPHQLVNDIQVTIYKAENLRIELEELFEERETYSEEEFKAKTQHIMNKYEIDDAKLDEILQNF